MDNITHSLIGVALGHAAGDTPRTPAHRAAIWTAVIGSNFPDCDIFLRPFFNNVHLGYLLQHRGYTHSFLMLPLFAGMSSWIGARVSKTQVTKKLLFLGAIAVALHIGADALNDYGVHPFSPFFNGWFYGDTLFIVEPLIWLSILPFAYFLGEKKWTRVLTLVTEVILFVLLWRGPFAPHSVAALASFWGVFEIGIFYLARGRRALALLALALSLILVIGTFAVFSYRVNQEVRGLSSIARGLVEIVRSPAPANPLCWRVIAVGANGDRYFAKVGVLNFASGWIPDACYFRVPLEGSASEGRVHWTALTEGSILDLKMLQSSNCQMRAFLKFARVPAWTETEAWDLRYVQAGGGGFATVDLADPECLSWVSPWIEPLKILSNPAAIPHEIPAVPH